MRAAIRKGNLFQTWHLLWIMTMLIAFLVTICSAAGAAGPNQEPDSLANTANNGSMHKVIAQPGLLDPGSEGITLWHDYGSFALYRVTDAALKGLPASMRSQVTISDDSDRLLIDRFEEFQDQAANRSEVIDQANTAGSSLHLIQFVGPIKDEWLRAVESTGASTIQYIATNGYLTWASSQSANQIDNMAQAKNILQFSAPYPLPLKIGPNLVKRDKLDEVVPVVIQMYRHEGAKASEAAIQALAVNESSDWTPI